MNLIDSDAWQSVDTDGDSITMFASNSSLSRATSLGVGSSFRCRLGTWLFSALAHTTLWVVLPLSGLNIEGHAQTLPQPPEVFVRCIACHGEQAQGLESLKSPNLAGREAWFLRKQIQDFRSRERGKLDPKESGFLAPEERTQWMHPVSDDLSRKATDAVVAYLSKLPVPTIEQPPLGDANRGRPLYQGCARCHGASGKGSRMKAAPSLTGQHGWYLFNQLRDFRMGWRGADSSNPHVKWMREQVNVNDEALRDLTAYIVRLNPTKR